MSKLARFAVINLRNALAPVASSSLPINRQRELEISSLDAARAELEHSRQQLLAKRVSSVADSHLQKERLQAWMHEWYGLLTARLTDDIAAMKIRVEGTVEKKTRRKGLAATKSVGMMESNMLLYLSLLPPDKVALITVLEAMRTVGSGGVFDGFKSMRGLMAIGRGVETEYRIETIKSVAGVDSTSWLRTIDPLTQKPSRKLIGSLWRSIGKRLLDKEKSALLEQDWRAVWTPSWSASVHADVGGYLMAALIDVAKVERTGTDPVTKLQMWVIKYFQDELIIVRSETQPAFGHSYEYVRGRKLGVIKVNPVVASRLSSDHLLSVVHPKHLPMLVEPRKWTSDDDGAYLLHRSELEVRPS